MFDGLRFSHWHASMGADGVLVLCVDRAGSGVNALSRSLLDELDGMLERIAIERPAAVVIHSGKASGFAVGADLKEFETYDRKGTVRDEIEHVAIGNKWYCYLCRERGLDPVQQYRELARDYRAPRQRGPFNMDARREAGFSQAELDALLEQAVNPD